MAFGEEEEWCHVEGIVGGGLALYDDHILKWSIVWVYIAFTIRKKQLKIFYNSVRTELTSKGMISISLSHHCNEI